MITNKELTFFQYAKKMSYLSDYLGGKCPIGCIAVYKHKVISTGCNKEKTNPLQAKYNIYRFTENSPHKIHAEIDCLSSLISSNIDFSKISLYIYRQTKDGNLALAKPCASCMALIRHLGIKHIYYTTNNSYCYEKLI